MNVQNCGFMFMFIFYIYELVFKITSSVILLFACWIELYNVDGWIMRKMFEIQQRIVVYSIEYFHKFCLQKKQITSP